MGSAGCLGRGRLRGRVPRLACGNVGGRLSMSNRFEIAVSGTSHPTPNKSNSGWSGSDAGALDRDGASAAVSVPGRRVRLG